MSDYVMSKVTSFVSMYHRAKLVYYAAQLKLPISRLVAMAIDNELSKEKPFDNFELNFPDEEFIEYAYLEQAGKIIDYLKKVSGFGLDQLLILRHDIGVPDKRELLLGLRESLTKGFIEGYKIKPKPWVKTEYDENYMFYRIKEDHPKERKKVRKLASDYSKLQRLKKQFNE